MNAIYNTFASGMEANQMWTEVIGNNITNMDTTRTDTGGPYQRQSIILKEKNGFNNFFQKQIGQGVEVAGVVQDPSTKTVYDPSNPDADSQGNVQYPNINLTSEMTDLIAAQKGYDANVTGFNDAKEMSQATAQIGKI
jgi:flagellar basal-body rod protein FlgC